MANTLKLPVGIENFEEIRKLGFYYIDKTRLIEQLLQGWGKVTLFTRPRRFGKTLNMSMLRSFFEIGMDKSLFDGLYISGNKVLCDEHMGKYPVIFLSFKGVDGLDFTTARRMLCAILKDELDRHYYLKTSDVLTDEDRILFTKMLHGQDDNIEDSIRMLSKLLYKHYGQKVVILIDEYDVPLDKAFQNGYYKEMVSLIRGLFGQALKTNEFLQFAVLTGCLRVSKESIFTGTNNFVSNTITSSHLNEYYGFVQSEVDKILEDAGIKGKEEVIKKWYDGYRFGDADVYCPWDVMCYIDDLQKNSNAEPDEYWKDTSDNAIIRSFIDYAGTSITKKMETLMSGGYIVQRVDENLTYDYLHSSEENLWSMMYLTGYLTRVRDGEINEALTDNMVALKIPNLEIKQIFETEVAEWFEESASKWNKNALFEAVWRGDCEKITREVSTLLRRTISYHDYGEDFYHAFLSGIFAGAGYQVDSNKEHGECRSDVVVCDTINGRVAIFEAKRAMTLGDLESACDKALRQIDQRMYAKDFEDEYDSDHIHCYGIAFYKKRCFVKKKD